jgi:hypothetical protein
LLSCVSSSAQGTGAAAALTGLGLARVRPGEI